MVDPTQEKERPLCIEIIPIPFEKTTEPEDESPTEKSSNLYNSSENASRSKDPIDETWQCPSYVDKKDINRFFLFGTPEAHVDISSLHPDQAEIFRLWQIYLENVDPLLKCTHTPTLQARIVDALGHITDVLTVLHALMFSIYCVSIMSLADDECLIRFGSASQALLAKYQNACQQALLRCKAWCSEDIDALTALYLYSVSCGTLIACSTGTNFTTDACGQISLRPRTDPRSLSTIHAILMRNAQRMRLHDDASNGKYPAMEAELRRRLWWSLVAMDHRICEMSEYKTSSLTPLWDCRMPLNVNDFELRSQMKVSPLDHDRPTEALFPFLWSRLINSLRHSDFHLSFINPALHASRRLNIAISEAGGVGEHEAVVEKHLAFCQADDPLGFMTIWTVRGHLARHRLLAHYAKYSKKSMQQTNSQRGVALSYALDMLECDTKIRTSPLTKRFLWFANLHIPIIAYFHIIHHARRHPNEPAVKEAWRVMRDHWNARAANTASKRKRNEQMTFEGFVQSVSKGWDAFRAALRRDIESEVLEKENLLGSGLNEDASITEPDDFDGQGMSKGDLFGLETGLYSDMAGQSAMGGELAHFWTTMDWTFIDPQGW